MKKVLFLMKIKEDYSNNYTPAVFNWYGILEKLGYEVFYEDYSRYNAEEFYQLVKQNKPDFIFHPTYDRLHTEFARLREFSKVYCIHSDDDWRFNDYIKFWIPLTDGAIGYQNNKISYITEGASENYYNRARWAFNPNTMYLEFSGDKSYQLSHVGGLHGNKLQRINELKSKGLDIELIDPKFTSYSAYLEAYHKSIASICLTGNSLNAAPQSKTRVAELPFYSILISEAWPNMDMWNMDPNKDFILIDESNNYLNLIDRILKDKQYANEMYQSGKNILINNNTVFHEWNKVMQSIDEDYKPVDVLQILKTYNL
jgi:hypothetical protein